MHEIPPMGLDSLAPNIHRPGSMGSMLYFDFRTPRRGHIVEIDQLIIRFSQSDKTAVTKQNHNGMRTLTAFGAADLLLMRGP